jgi:hypothetical protein
LKRDSPSQPGKFPAGKKQNPSKPIQLRNQHPCEDESRRNSALISSRSSEISRRFASSHSEQWDGLPNTFGGATAPKRLQNSS